MIGHLQTNKVKYIVGKTSLIHSVDSLHLDVYKRQPVDSYVTPEPWAMPGYDSDVIMAAGAFVQGSSIELSACLLYTSRCV